MKDSILYSLVVKICSVIMVYYENSILAKLIGAIVRGICISYETSYINMVIKDKKDIFQESLFRKIVDFFLKIVNIIFAFINRLFSKSKYSKSNDLISDLSNIDKLLALFGKFLFAYGIVSTFISLVMGKVLIGIIMLVIAFIGLVFSSTKSMEYFRRSLIYRVLTYFVSFRSKEWN